MGEDFLEHAAHREVVPVALVVVDVPPGDGGLIQVIDEDLLAQRQGREAVGVELHDGGFVHPLEEVGPGIDV